MKYLALFGFVALAAAWTPGTREECDGENAQGGSILLPHETYCQLYYSCNIHGDQWPQYCPGGMLFAYAPGLAVCVTEGLSIYNCPNWPCSVSADVGRRYPDTCCDKYWECTEPGVFSTKECAPGTSYDMNSEQCLANAACTDHRLCSKNLQPTNIDDCLDSVSPSDPCMYRTRGYDVDRQCPTGTSFDSSTCQCSLWNEGCAGSGLTLEQLIENKSPDTQCRASGKLQFGSNNELTVVSDKFEGRKVDHYFHIAEGFSTSSLEGVFDAGNNQVPLIYDYYYNDNTLYAPFAITMTVRFDFNSGNIQRNQEFSLLENRWSTDPTNTHCIPTLKISAKYLGIISGSRFWAFSVKAKGENNVENTLASTISGSANDYFRVVFTFGVGSDNGAVTMGGSVSNRGQANQANRKVDFVTDNRSMGSALQPTKCGFAIGRGLSGRVREFNVYEGCANFDLL